jgi:hypothetical protein
MEPLVRWTIIILILPGFPALAIRTQRRMGNAGLARLTIIVLGAILVYALLVATGALGAELQPVRTLPNAATDALARFLLIYGTPVVAASIATASFAHDRLPFWAVYSAVVGAAAVGWMVGVGALTWVLPLFAG